MENRVGESRVKIKLDLSNQGLFEELKEAAVEEHNEWISQAAMLKFKERQELLMDPKFNNAFKEKEEEEDE